MFNINVKYIKKEILLGAHMRCNKKKLQSFGVPQKFGIFNAPINSPRYSLYKS